MLHWHSHREDLIGVIALIVYVITCGSLSGGRNGSIFDSHTIYFFPLERSTSKSHPCVYGGKASAICNFAMAVGSPPRMRGKGLPCLACLRGHGITPAHAGKSSWIQNRCLSGMGSPPRMRGKALTQSWPGCVLRDHPRACGEKAQGQSRLRRWPGSPPRMRGKVWASSPSHVVAGITPAHAGKSRHFACGRCGRWDHPRACGEKSGISRYCTRCRGSPPRMRGKAHLRVSRV